MSIRLSRQFSIFSLVGIVFIAFSLGLLYRLVSVSHLKQQIAFANSQLSQFIAQSILSEVRESLLHNQISPDKPVTIDKQYIERLDKEILQLAKHEMIVKIKIFNLAGFVVYSTKHSDIGKEVKDYDEFVTAKQGMSATELDFKESITGIDGKTVLHNRNIVSTYLPVRSTTTGNVIGVFELYTDATKDVASIHDAELIINGTVLLLLFFLYLFLLFYIRKADAIIQKNEQDLKLSQEKELYKLANYDITSGLPNRNMFASDLHQMLSADDHPDFAAVLIVHIDRMDWINNYGIEFSNKVILTVANYLNISLREMDRLYRIDGTEFGVILRYASRRQHVEIVLKHLQESLAEPLKIYDRNIQISMSIGISIYPDDAADAEELIAHATSAAHRARDIGGNRYLFYSHDINKVAMQRYELETELQHALSKGQFEVYYQPKVDVQKNAIIGAEALLRWNHPTKGFIYPDKFIHLLESTGHIIPVGQWVMTEACRQCIGWHETGFKDMTVAVNVSGKQFNSDLLLQAKQALFDSNLPARFLELEITESVLADNNDKVIDTLASIKQTGIKLSIDDFGTGYSSLVRLATYPVDYLKVDKTFIDDITINQRNASITATIIAMSQSLDLGVVVEGVESKQQLEFLTKLDCNIVQGFYYSKPLPAGEFMELLHSGRFARRKTA